MWRFDKIQRYVFNKNSVFVANRKTEYIDIIKEFFQKCKKGKIEERKILMNYNWDSTVESFLSESNMLEG